MKLKQSSVDHGLKINSVNIPEQMRQRVSTGIDWLDESLGYGGFVPSNIAMLTGDPGAGKTTFALQLAESLTKKGNIVLFNTGEQSLAMVKLMCERLKFKTNFYVGQDTLVEDVLTHANMLREKHPGKQVFLIQDSLPTLDDGKYGGGFTNSKTATRVVEQLVDWCKETYGVAIFINHVLKSGEFAGKNDVLHAIDMHLRLYIDHAKRSQTYGERIGMITKNRWGVSGRMNILGMSEQEGIYLKGIVTDVEE
jgi:DNA repair protein RadA/Sms